ncbi:MAG TPA: hypothetical protein VKB73_01230 [Gaiellaceae bacterium]|jgi:hypothetical protein|nr:hypothetical protein [Gaiellaceae bacterium]
MTKARLISLMASLSLLAFYFEGAARGLGQVGGHCFGWGPGSWFDGH